MPALNFLEKYTLQPLADIVADHTIPPTATWLCPLSHFSLITLQGEDSFEFLNNNLSSDIKQVSETHAQLSSHCNAQGRADGCFLVFKQDDKYFLRTTATLHEAQIQRLQIFILRAKVTLGTSDYGGIGIAGKHAKQQLESLGILPLTHSHEQCVVKLPGDTTECYEIYAPEKRLATIWEALTAAVTLVENDGWRLLNMLAGLPNIYPETTEQFVPQMLNLDVLEGISFSKGCYPGQEIIARTHFLGKLKRRMFAFKTHSLPNETVTRGTPVFVPAYSADQPSGSVIDVCTFKETVVGLVVLRTQGIESGLFLHRNNGTEMDLLPLPYTLPPQSFDPQKNPTPEAG